VAAGSGASKPHRPQRRSEVETGGRARPPALERTRPPVGNFAGGASSRACRLSRRHLDPKRGGELPLQRAEVEALELPPRVWCWITGVTLIRGASESADAKRCAADRSAAAPDPSASSSRLRPDDDASDSWRGEPDLVARGLHARRTSWRQAAAAMGGGGGGSRGWPRAAARNPARLSEPWNKRGPMSGNTPSRLMWLCAACQVPPSGPPPPSG